MKPQMTIPRATLPTGVIFMISDCPMCIAVTCVIRPLLPLRPIQVETDNSLNFVLSRLWTMSGGVSFAWTNSCSIFSRSPSSGNPRDWTRIELNAPATRLNSSRMSVGVAWKIPSEIGIASCLMALRGVMIRVLRVSESDISSLPASQSA